MHRVVLDLDHASRRSGPQPLSSGFLPRDRLHASTRRRRCCCGLLDVLVCLLVCLSVTPCATFSWCSMSCPLANCSLVYSMLTHVLRVVCWTASPSCSRGQPEYGCERASRVLLWPPGRDPAKKLLEQSSTLLLTCSHRFVGHVPRGQWALLDADMLVLIDRSACLVEPCTCGRHTKCSPHGPLTVSVVRSFAPRSIAPALALGLDLLLDDLLLSLHSFTTHLNDSLTGSFLEALGFVSFACNLLIRAVTDPHTWPSVVVCACSRVSPRTEPPLPEPA